jgi:hypothetical protein
MSLFHLLVVSGLVAAVAFFLAGYLLRSPRAAGVVRDDDRLHEAQKISEAALADAQAECKRQEEKRGLAERERDDARAEAERSATKERTLAERLRVAEDQNRAAFEHEEKQAEAWGAQLEASRAEKKRLDHALHEELEQLRSRAGNHEAESARLAEERDRHQARTRELEQSLEGLRTQSQHPSEEASRERERLQRALSSAEERERALLVRLAETEESGHGKAAAAEDALRALQAAAQAERQQLALQIQQNEAALHSEREAQQDLAIRLRALEETIEHEREQGRTATEALRAAETRLADLDRLSQENAVLREQKAESEREAKWQAGRGDEAKDVKVELAAAQAKLVELGRTLEENRKLRDEAAELRQHQEASEELERLTAAHKQLRLDAELMARRLQELMQDRGELVSLRSQAAEAASLVEEVAYLRRREKDLEAQLYASGLYASREMPAVSGEVLMQTPVSDMETNLHSLVGSGGPRTAVLADAQGFLIAGAGESAAQEGLAAFAAVAGEMVSRARMLLPLAEVDSVRVTDINSMVLTCHLFDSAGEGLGVATLGPGEPEAGNTARAIVELAAIVSGAEPARAEEPVSST